MAPFILMTEDPRNSKGGMMKLTLECHKRGKAALLYRRFRTAMEVVHT